MMRGSIWCAPPGPVMRLSSACTRQGPSVKGAGKSDALAMNQSRKPPVAAAVRAIDITLVGYPFSQYRRTPGSCLLPKCGLLACVT
jgi:hypothetical protein